MYLDILDISPDKYLLNACYAPVLSTPIQRKTINPKSMRLLIDFKNENHVIHMHFHHLTSECSRIPFQDAVL